MVIDSHLHVWERSEGHYSWLVPHFGAIYDDFPPSLAGHELSRAGVDGAILVQADDSLHDANYMFQAARQHNWVWGVVPWLPLDSPGRAENLLEEYQREPSFCGVRQLVHDDPRDDFYRMAEVHEVLAALGELGIPVDVPDAWPRDLPQVVDIAATYPATTFVLDHLGKPPIEPGDFARWKSLFIALADCPNTVVKFSGLHHPYRPFTHLSIESIWDLTLEVWGPKRVMVGSDWPITVGYGGYQPTWEVMAGLINGCEPHVRYELEAGTATRTYGRSEVLIGYMEKEGN